MVDHEAGDRRIAATETLCQGLEIWDYAFLLPFVEAPTTAHAGHYLYSSSVPESESWTGGNKPSRMRSAPYFSHTALTALK